MRPCQEYAEDIVLLALGDRDLEHRRRLEAHIQACPACRRYLQDVRSGLALLGEAPPAVTPPARLKQRVLEEFRRVHGPRRRLSRLWPAAVAAAAALLLVLNAALAVSVWRLQREVAALTRLVEVSGTQLAVAYDLMSLMGIPSDATVELKGEAPAPEASGKAAVYSTASGTLLVLTVWNLPPLPDEAQVYQVWLIEDGRRVNAGVFRVDPRGTGTLIYRHPGQARFEAVGVTVEPDPYGEQPRGQRVMSGQLGS